MRASTTRTVASSAVTRQYGDHQLIQHQLEALQAIRERLADGAGVPVQVEAQRQMHQVREQPLTEGTEHAPLDAPVEQSPGLRRRRGPAIG